MTHEDVQRWLDGYLEAWRAKDAELIGNLFTENAVYSYRPWEDDDVAVRGRDAIVANWLETEDPFGWEARYEPYAVDGNRAVGVGWTRYNPTDSTPERLFHNAFLLEFGEDGRCSGFREFYYLQEAAG